MSLKAWLLAGIAALVALVVQLAPGEPDDPTWSDQPQRGLVVDGDRGEEYIEFQSDRGETLRGRLFLPEQTAIKAQQRERPRPAPPVIVMAHGLGLSQDCHLEETFVRAFVEAGLAAFTLDYATFGASAGTPRHQVHPHHHVADLRAAIATLRKRSSSSASASNDNNDVLPVDTTRLALWGTSLGGGHVLTLAASAHDDDKVVVRAVVAQVPAVASASETVLGTLARDPVRGLWGLVQILSVALKWLVQWIWTMGRSTWYLPLTGPPGSTGMMQNEGDQDSYLSLVPPSGGAFGWRNAATLPSVVRVLLYRPLSRLSRHAVKVPVLLVAAQNDTLCPSSYVEQAAQRIGRADTELLVLPGAQHFDVYSGEAHEMTIATTVAFFHKHLK